MRKAIAILIFIVGIACLGGSYYIKDQVIKGQSQIDSAQKKVDQADALFSLSPYTEGLGKGITGGVQGKIDEGQQEVNRYTELSHGLKLAGIILTIFGAALSVMAFLPKKKAP